MSSTLLPFLYQTRTLQHALRRPLLTRALHTSRPYAHPAPKRTQKQSDDDLVPFDFGPDQASMVTRKKRTPGSTITETEKKVFDEIFGAISQRRKQLGDAFLPTVEPAPRERLPGNEPDPEKDEQELNRERILAMYPPGLRHAAQIALGIQAEEDEGGRVVSEGLHDYTTDEAAESDAEVVAQLEEAREAQRAALFALHRSEKDLFENLLHTCPSDAAVWDILEERVFSMVERLGIAEKTPSPARRGPKSKTPAPPPVPLSMERFGPLYSVHLLSALRHLDRGFAHPSPLTLNVLPRVLELGMASFVLGVSTRFCNELLAMYWHRHGDTPSFVRLLRDMERAGLAPDRHTLRLVETVMGALESVGEPGADGFSRVMGSMEEFDTVAWEKLDNHRRRVVASIEQQVGGLPF